MVTSCLFLLELRCFLFLFCEGVNTLLFFFVGCGGGGL